MAQKLRQAKTVLHGFPKKNVVLVGDIAFGQKYAVQGVNQPLSRLVEVFLGIKPTIRQIKALKRGFTLRDTEDP